MFSTENIFVQKYVRPKSFFGRKHFRPKIVSTGEQVVPQKLFRPISCFRPKKLLTLLESYHGRGATTNFEGLSFFFVFLAKKKFLKGKKNFEGDEGLFIPRNRHETLAKRARDDLQPSIFPRRKAIDGKFFGFTN